MLATLDKCLDKCLWNEWIKERCSVFSVYMLIIVGVHLFQTPFPWMLLPVLVFLNLGTVVIEQIVLCCGDSPVSCKMFSKILGLYPLDAGSTASFADLRHTEVSLDIARCPLGVLGQNQPKLRTAGSGSSLGLGETKRSES